MADTKITALTALTAADPINDVIPIVDVSDTSMAASGTTKKISVNNILSSSPTASGALTVTGLVTAGSATITGALDAARLNVTAATIPANGVYLVTTNKIGFSTNSTQRLTIDATGNLENTTTATQNGFLGFSNTVDGGTLGYFGNPRAFITGGATSSVGIRGESSVQFSIGANLGMTLDSTGLGIGDSPSYKLHVAKTTDGTLGFFRRISGTINPALTVYCNETGNTVGFGTDYAGATSPSITFTTGGSERVRIDATGNVKISATTASAADDRLVFSENMGSVNLGSQIVWQNSSFSTPYASIGVSNGAAGSNGTLIFSTCSSIFTNTNTERVRIKPTGQVRFFPLAADPAGAETGDVYYNSVSNKLKCYNGTIWNDLF